MRAVDRPPRPELLGQREGGAADGPRDGPRGVPRIAGDDHVDVAEVKPCAAGDSVGYGRRFVAREATMIATVPIGYGDGVRRALTNNADVVVRGRRFPLTGTVSMDNVTLDLGPDGGGVRRGDDALLLGGGVTAEEWAQRLGTINYEITCALTPRVPRAYHRDGVPA